LYSLAAGMCSLTYPNWLLTSAAFTIIPTFHFDLYKVNGWGDHVYPLNFSNFYYKDFKLSIIC